MKLKESVKTYTIELSEQDRKDLLDLLGLAGCLLDDMKKDDRGSFEERIKTNQRFQEFFKRL